MKVEQVIMQCERSGVQLERVGKFIQVTPKDRITNELRDAIRQHKVALLEALTDRHEAVEERAAVLEYDQGFERKAAEREARGRIQYVTCESCAHWTGDSPCGAGLHTSGDPISGVAVRICGFHTQKGVQS